MAATACAYGFDSGRRPPMPALQVMASFDDDDDDRGRHCSIIDDHCCVVHGVVMPPPPAPPPPPPPLPPPPRHRHPGLCTEGLGSESSESSGDLDLAGTVADDGIEDCKSQQQQHSDDQGEPPTPARTRGGKRVFPPPISVIGAAGKPWQYLRAQRGGGRLVLREVRIPSRELLHACREDGRLKLHFAHPEPEERHHHLADDQECCNN